MTTPLTHANNQPPEELIFRALLVPIVIIGIVQIVSLYTPFTELVRVIAHGMLIFYIIFRSTEHALSWKVLALIAGLAGGLSSLFPLFFQLFTQFHIVYLFSLFTTPLIHGTIDALVAGFLFILFSLSLQQKKRISQTKPNEKQHT